MKKSALVLVAGLAANAVPMRAFGDDATISVGATDLSGTPDSKGSQCGIFTARTGAIAGIKHSL